MKSDGARSVLPPRRAALVSLGCNKNTVDSELALGFLKNAGWELLTDPSEATVIIVNTCGFIEAAKQEAIDTILELSRSAASPRPYLAAVGCLAERYGAQLLTALPELAAVIGPGYWEQLPQALERVLAGERVVLTGELPLLQKAYHSRILSTPRSYAYLKLADGCDNHCRYCAIPLIRGRLRSRQLEDLCREAQDLAGQGFRELILIAQDTTAYGHDLGMKHGLVELLSSLERLPGDFMLRLMYAHPAHVDENLIAQFRTNKRLLPYLDLPLQHSHPTVLQQMGRPYNSRSISSIVSRLRRARPEIAVRTTVMVGFPGETEDRFQHLVRFLARLGVRHLGGFIYSPEENTAAAALPATVPLRVAKRRLRHLMAVHQKRSKLWLRSFVGSVLPVLIDGLSEESEYLLAGRTVFQAPEVDGVVLVANDGVAKPGDRVQVKITKAMEYDLVGEIVGSGEV